MSLKEKIANILDMLADEHDARPANPAFVAAPEEDPVVKFASAYRSVTGEELDDNLRMRLADDDELRDVIAKVASSSTSRPTPLGEALDNNRGAEEARTKSKEAAEREAYDRFAQGILSIGQR